jgi:hypothetical protein
MIRIVRKWWWMANSGEESTIRLSDTLRASVALFVENEFVKTIELQLGYLIPFIFCYRLNDGVVDGVLDFLRQSATLRTVRLR